VRPFEHTNPTQKPSLLQGQNLQEFEHSRKHPLRQ
jgi:hypothetical protein